jgi:histidyl-tRNA synthetase
MSLARGLDYYTGIIYEAVLTSISHIIWRKRHYYLRFFYKF